MRALRLAAGAAIVLTCSTLLSAAGLGDDWPVVRGEWGWTREIIPMVRQAAPAGTAVAFAKEPRAAHGAWRAAVAPTLGTREAGVWLQGGRDLKSGFLVVLGGNPGVGGFALKSADGNVLWQDRFAPWQRCHAYVVEGVVERGRVRAQMFEADGRTLVSQSPWVAVPEAATNTPGLLGLTTLDGIARFWDAERAEAPLSPIVPDAPNKRRLIQDEKSPWLVVGPGNWTWATGKRQRLRQGANVYRATAIHRGIRGALRTWECRLRIHPRSGGAGMVFQANDKADQGFLAWLGGTHGAGCLMLYELPLKARWSGPQGKWRWNTDYLLRAETRKGEARVQLLATDGKTIIQQSPWVKVGAAAARGGAVGFMTYRGTADFWGFSEATQVAKAPPKPQPAAAYLGAGWQAHGDGTWHWADKARTRLRQTGKPKLAVALSTPIVGVTGTWRCRVNVAKGTQAAGLVFQAGPGRTLGFACLLTTAGAKLQALGGKTLWEKPDLTWSPGTEYVLEGRVMTDRVAARVLAADGKTVLAQSPDIYVPDTNNARRGHLGLLVRGGQADFWGWQLTK